MDSQTIIARRIARELSPGMLVNLGIGIPTLVANHVPAGMQVFFQSENGLIGTGSVPAEGMAHPMLTDAAGKPVTALPGASTFDSAMSFGLIRGGHLDLTVLGGLQVDQVGQQQPADPGAGRTRMGAPVPGPITIVSVPSQRSMRACAAAWRGDSRASRRAPSS